VNIGISVAGFDVIAARRRNTGRGKIKRVEKGSGILAGVALAPPPRMCGGRDPADGAGSSAMSVLAFAAGGWAVLMGLAPLLQVRRMLQRRSSADVSVGYLLVLLPGFALWVAYGVALGDRTLVIPNVVAFTVTAGTVGCALRLRSR
jgi:MtN3 and saliva related transmembrane protein